MAKKSSYQESMEEMGLGSRAKSYRAFIATINKQAEKKKGETLKYPVDGETTYGEKEDGKWGEIVICTLIRGTKLTLLKDCTDGADGIYFTDKGNFFARNFDLVREDHPIYELAKAKGFI